jgi:Mor family transcriptional regulator
MKITDEEMQEYFPKVYPKIFSGKYGGIAVGNGWFDLLNQACLLIQSHLDWKKDIPQVVAEQVKEKFGGLRFYVSGGDDYTEGIIAMAEQMSGLTCEECGAPGESGGNGWISTLCATHRAERNAAQAKRMEEYEAQKQEQLRIKIMKQEGHEE